MIMSAGYVWETSLTATSEATIITLANHQTGCDVCMQVLVVVSLIHAAMLPSTVKNATLVSSGMDATMGSVGTVEIPTLRAATGSIATIPALASRVPATRWNQVPSP